MDSKDEVFRQITSAWEKAQAQLEELKQAVQRTEQMASLRAQAGSSLREHDRALRDLGERVWEAVKAGRLSLPQGFEAFLKVIEQVEQKKAALSSQISDILLEGEETAGRKAEKPGPPKSGLASKPKIR